MSFPVTFHKWGHGGLVLCFVRNQAFPFFVALASWQLPSSAWSEMGLITGFWVLALGRGNRENSTFYFLGRVGPGSYSSPFVHILLTGILHMITPRISEIKSLTGQLCAHLKREGCSLLRAKRKRLIDIEGKVVDFCHKCDLLFLDILQFSLLCWFMPYNSVSQP